MSDDNPLTYTANQDGTIVIKDSEGKDTRYAKESDLLAVKGSAETLERQAADSQSAHKAEIETANTNLDATRQQVLQAEATISSLEEQVKTGAGSAEELANVKQELETAKTSGEELSTKALEYRRQIIVATYGIPADTVKEKTMGELDNYEQALKAVIATRGVGNYALGGGGGGPSLVGIPPLELARIAYEQSTKK